MDAKIISIDKGQNLTEQCYLIEHYYKEINYLFVQIILTRTHCP